MLYQQTREEMSRLKSELKAFNKSRATLTDSTGKQKQDKQTGTSVSVLPVYR